MYLMENIIRTTYKENKKLSIMIINEDNEDYIYNLSKLEHNFYIIQNGNARPNWLYDFVPNNIIFINNIYEIGVKNIDCILVFNRLNSYESASIISKQYHIPIIVIDLASSETKEQIPFFVNSNIENENSMYLRNGNISVGISEFTTQSWHSHKQYFGITVIPITEKIETIKNEKILLDKMLNKEYIDNLPLNIDKKKYTTNPQYAICYLHLWKNITPLMLQCMYSGIPVVTFNSIDFHDIIEKEACVLIEDLYAVNNINFINLISNFIKNKNIIENAKNFIDTKIAKNNDFITSWNNIFNYISHMPYLRGLYD